MLEEWKIHEQKYLCTNGIHFRNSKITFKWGCCVLILTCVVDFLFPNFITNFKKFYFLSFLALLKFHTCGFVSPTDILQHGLYSFHWMRAYATQLLAGLGFGMLNYIIENWLSTFKFNLCSFQRINEEIFYWKVNIWYGPKIDDRYE